MALPLPTLETDFIRIFAGTYRSEIGLMPKAEEDQARLGIGLQDVIYALQNGSVTSTSKEDADGARWTIEGETVNGQGLRISVQVWVTLYCVRVLRIDAK